MNIDIHDIYSYLNKPKLNDTLSDKEFDLILDDLSKSIYNKTFDSFIQEYNDKFLTNVFKDWENLKKRNIEKNYINSTSTTGMNIIKKYMIHIYHVENYKGISIKKLWSIENIKRVLKINRKTHSTPYVSEIIRQLGFMAGTSKITIYRPLLTKRIVQYFNSQTILDVCVGWGGRMLGTASIESTHYTGIEPCTKTYIGLTNIKNILNLENITLYNDTAESILPKLINENKKYDIALTSPPYYNLEIYSNEETQSHHYGSYQEWYTNFLKPVVQNVLLLLRENGKSCWSVKNFKTDKQYNLLDDIIKIHQDQGWYMIDTTFYVGNSTRPGAKEKNGSAKKNKEMTYVFIKE